MATKPEIRKGTGPNQLPQGAATTLNEATPAPTQAAQPPAETQPTEQPAAPFSVGQGNPPQFVSPRPAPQAQSENDQLLFGPVGAQVGANISNLGPVPPDIVGYLPVLARAASQPGAPPALTALLRVLVDKIDQTGY